MVEEKEEKTELPQEKINASLEELTSIGEKLKQQLNQAGFKTLEDIAKADIKELLKIKEIGETKAKKLIEEVNRIIKGNVEEK
jgi:transcription termination factor NusA